MHIAKTQVHITEDQIKQELKQLNRYLPREAWTNEDLVMLAQRGTPAERRMSTRLLIEKNQGMVAQYAHKYRGMLPIEDLMQEGNIGLLRAIQNYDPSKGAKFHTYARYWVQQAIEEAARREEGAVALPAYQRQRLLNIRRAAEKLRKKFDREPTAQEISKETRIPVKVVEQLMRGHRYVEELDESAVYDGRGKREGKDIPIDYSEEELADKELVALLPKLVKRLQPRERQVIIMRFGLPPYDRSYTLQEIADEMSLSNEAVRQIQFRALAKIRKMDEVREIREAQIKVALIKLRTASVDEFIQWRFAKTYKFSRYMGYLGVEDAFEYLLGEDLDKAAFIKKEVSEVRVETSMGPHYEEVKQIIAKLHAWYESINRAHWAEPAAIPKDQWQLHERANVPLQTIIPIVEELSEAVRLTLLDFSREEKLVESRYHPLSNKAKVIIPMTPEKHRDMLYDYLKQLTGILRPLGRVDSIKYIESIIKELDGVQQDKINRYLLSRGRK
jgi:RNA polymerase sigma factor (sigma-70 family)